MSTSPGFLAARKLRHAIPQRAARCAASMACRARDAHQEVDVAPDVVVEDRDVAARHVRDVMSFSFSTSLRKHAAHRDHVVVRVRRKADDALARAAAWTGRGCCAPSRVEHQAIHVAGDCRAARRATRAGARRSRRCVSFRIALTGR